MFAVANIIIAIQKCNPKLITKYIIYESEDFPVAQSDKRIIEKLFPSLIEFRTYTPPQNIKVPDLKSYTEDIHRYFSANSIFLTC